MKLLTASQIREWDAYTILHEPIASIDLMERAAKSCYHHLIAHFAPQRVTVFCGSGNNGGDGLAIASMLAEVNFEVEVVLVFPEQHGSNEYAIHLNRLRQNETVNIIEFSGISQLSLFSPNELVIDAIFGTGLSRPLANETAQLVNWLNQQDIRVIAIDIPTGLPSEIHDAEALQSITAIEAECTLTFQVPKLSFMHAETNRYVGDFQVLEIGLHPGFLKDLDTPFHYLTNAGIKSFLKPRSKFSHKGNQGHVLICGGSFGKIGAVILSCKAAFRSGCGLVTAYVPRVGYTIVQTAIPEVMVDCDTEMMEITHFPEVSSYDAVAIGPGMGTAEPTTLAFKKWLGFPRPPMVIDADGINNLAKLLKADPLMKLPTHLILTPHPKEFDRLVGPSKNTFERLQRQIEFSKKHRVTVVLKGAHTSITTAEGEVYFNSTGNPLLAVAGSGDVLTGIIVSLLAQGLSSVQAALAGVYLHGLCADEHQKREVSNLLASEITEVLPHVLYKFTVK